MEALFWSAATLILYTYAGYPLLIHWLARRRPAPASPEPPSAWPSVAIVMAAYNERARLPQKLESLWNLDYPREKIRIYCVSDGSTDGTNEYLLGHKAVHAIILPRRSGKPSALNAALEQVTEEVVVFTDARQILAPDAVRNLVSRLMQPGVGAVSGELLHRPPNTATAKHVGLYWLYEKWIRKNESRYHSVPGVSGALYAIRRDDYAPLAPDTILDDFEVPMAILRSGRRVLLEPTARAYDELPDDPSHEWARKTRTLAGNFQSFSRNSWLFSPKANPIFFQFISHKVLRLLMPYALLITLVTSSVAPGVFYTGIFALQLFFYSGSILGWLHPATRRFRLVSFATVFVELNLAAVAGLVRHLSGRTDVRWDKT